RIDRINIKNFRGIEDLTLDLNPRFNLLIGENGSGKTAILSALAVAVGPFISGMGVTSRIIEDSDLRYFKTSEGSFEYASLTEVSVENGFVNGGNLTWQRSRHGNKPTYLHHINALFDYASQLLDDIGDPRRTEKIALPAIAFYATSRLWEDETEDAKVLDGNGNSLDALPSRFRGYHDALEAKPTFRKLLQWFEGKYADMRITGKSTFQLDCVEAVIVANIPGVERMKWVFDSDKIQTLYIVFQNGDEIPFSYLSDGYRNLLAMFADLAWRLRDAQSGISARMPQH
ncbi:MAG: AAA family ATPase, partial [Bacteroidetes bacterium]|nr:AAA family ATPase [Bacteroidota bacterium]